MRVALATLAAVLFAASPLVQAAGPFQSELLHMDLPNLSASAPSNRSVAKPQARETVVTPVTAGRGRAEVLAELRAARASGELDHASAEAGLPAGIGRLQPITRLAGASGSAADRQGSGQR
jgi:hypothetical protein